MMPSHMVVALASPSAAAAAASPTARTAFRQTRNPQSKSTSFAPGSSSGGGIARRRRVRAAACPEIEALKVMPGRGGYCEQALDRR
jgi:hypothetical protein